MMTMGTKNAPCASLNIFNRCVSKLRIWQNFRFENSWIWDWRPMDFRIYNSKKQVEQTHKSPSFCSICQEGFKLMVHLVGGDVASSSMESVELMISIPEVKQKHFVLQKAGTRKGGIMEISSLITSNFVFIKGSSCTDCLNLSVLNIRVMLIYSIYRCGNCPRVITPRWTKEQRRSYCQKALNQWRWRWP